MDRYYPQKIPELLVLVLNDLVVVQGRFVLAASLDSQTLDARSSARGVLGRISSNGGGLLAAERKDERGYFF